MSLPALAVLHDGLDLEPTNFYGESLMEGVNANVGYMVELLEVMSDPDPETACKLGEAWKADPGYIETLREGYPSKGKGAMRKLGDFRGALVGVYRHVARRVLAGPPYPWEEGEPAGEDERVQDGQAPPQTRGGGTARPAQRGPQGPEGGRGARGALPEDRGGQAGPVEATQGVAPGDGRPLPRREAGGAPGGDHDDGVRETPEGPTPSLDKRNWKPEQWARYLKGREYIEKTYKKFPKKADEYLSTRVAQGLPIKRSEVEGVMGGASEADPQQTDWTEGE